MAGTRKRRTWKAEDKLRIVLAGLDGSTEISELCRREGINPTQYYGWKKQLLSSAQRVFSDGCRFRFKTRPLYRPRGLVHVRGYSAVPRG